MDRFADRANRLSEVLDAVDVRHIARLEMHFRDAQIVLTDETEQDFREESAFLQSQASHDAEIERDDALLRIDEKIALMHVGVEKAVAQGVPKKGLDQATSQRRRIEAELRQTGRIGQRRPVD